MSDLLFPVPASIKLIHLLRWDCNGGQAEALCYFRSLPCDGSAGLLGIGEQLEDNPMARKKTPTLNHVRTLFVDDAPLAETRGLRRTVHQLTKDPAEPVLHCDRPWEGGKICGYGSVWRQDGDGPLRMWYLARPGNPNDRRYHTSICLATSIDGVHWEKPALHRYDYWGNSANNICILPHWKNANATGRFDTVSILDDAEEHNLQRRYKMMSFQYAVPDKWKPNHAFPSGYYVAFSPDGLHWYERPRPVFRLDEGVGDCMTLMHDTRRGRYTAFVKILSNEYGMQPRLRRPDDNASRDIWDGKRWIRATGENPLRRMRGISHSSDFIHWTSPRFILPTDDLDPVDVQFYNNTGFEYESMYLGFVYVYHVDTTGTIDMQLIWSRDGETWNRAFDRTAILPSGAGESDWDMGCHAMLTNPPIRMGDELWFYYGSSWTRHSGGKLRVHRGSGGAAIGRAKLRIDGFVSLDAGSRMGRAVTTPLKLGATALAVNADAGSGEIRAQILRRGRPLPGFDLQSCQPLKLDRTRHLFRFEGGKIPKISEPVRIEFALKNASIYSFWSEPQPRSNL